MLLAAGGLAASALPGAAEAKPNNGLLAQGVKATYTGKSNARGSLTADILVQKLSVEDGKSVLTVQGLIASPKGGTGGLAPFTSQTFEKAKAKLKGGSSGEASCGALTLDIKNIRLDIRGGLTIDPEPVEVDLTGLTGRGRQLGVQLCALADLLDGEGSREGLQDLLDRINKILANNLILVPKSKAGAGGQAASSAG